MSKYKVGIVGFGWVAGAHLASLRDAQGLEPVAILSRRELDARAINEEYGVDVEIHNDYDKFLTDGDLDIVDICTPSFLHSEQTIAASESGKHIIIEKPIALNLDDAKKMLEVVERNRSLTSVCFELRFHSAITAIQSILQQDLIGEVHYAEADYFHGIGPWYANQEWEVKQEFGGSSLLRAGCHALDALLYLIDSQVEEVFSYGNTSSNEAYKDYDYDLNTVSLLKFENGAVAKVSSCTDCSQPYAFNLNLVGSQGSVKNDQLFSKRIEGMKEWTQLGIDLADSGDVGNHPYVSQFEHFAECLAKGIDPHNNLRDAVDLHRVITAADLSAETGRPVALSELS